ALYGVAVDVGYEPDGPPAPGVAKGFYGKSGAPITAANADVNNIAPAPFGVGALDKRAYALALEGYRGRRGGVTQHRMPGRTLFGIVYVLTRKQGLPGIVQAASLQQ